MPLTALQKSLAQLLAANRSPDSYLAGGAAIHFEPQSARYSNDLDYFHDSVERVAQAFASDRELLVQAGCVVSVEMSQPGYLRALVSRAHDATKIEWAHDSAWRFMPTVLDAELGYRLHPIDLAVNKVLTLAGRDELRDLVDTVILCREVLPLGALCWAAAGKDPGFTPTSLLEMLRRRGKVRSEDLARLHFAAPWEATALKTAWLALLDAGQHFVTTRPPEELGCLYYAPALGKFVEPSPRDTQVIPHHGRPGGVLPAILDV